MVSEVKQRTSAKKSATSKKDSRPAKQNEPDISDKKTTTDKQAGTQKIGHLGIKKEDQIWSRAVLMTGVLVIVIVMKWKKSNEITWASSQETVAKPKTQPLICSTTFLDEINKFQGCKLKQCGRFVMDGLFSEDQVNTLLSLFKKGLQFGHSSGGASILDLHSGALSKGERFINIFSNPETRNIWTEAELSSYVDAKEKVRQAVSENFGLQPEAIHLTSPTFFSRMTETPAKTVHDEYWHPHVDKETYETFHFTSLLYLSDYGSEFQGGRFVFIDGDHMNRTVEPKKGRVSMFTSGAENLHYVEKVTQGIRYALTIAFTCDAQHAIPDPLVKLYDN